MRKKFADALRDNLRKEGFWTDSMHGGKTQEARLNALNRFKNDEVKLLVATDVMGRGLDIRGISHCVIYDMGDAEDYVHRIGRTARGPYGKGHALAFFEYFPRYPEIAGDLIQILEDSGQAVPDELRSIAQEVLTGKREAKPIFKKYPVADKMKSWAGDPFAKFKKGEQQQQQQGDMWGQSNSGGYHPGCKKSGGGVPPVIISIPAELKVWIGGLPKGTDWNQLKDHFEQVARTRWVAPIRQGQGGMAVVAYQLV